MSFAEDLKVFSLKLERRSKDLLVGCAQAVHESVTEGSPITGAPGQPVDTGFLKGSWQVTFPSDDTALVATNADYAEAIEDGIGRHGALTLRSEVGGFHSVKLTRASWDRVVEDIRSRVVGGDA